MIRSLVESADTGGGPTWNRVLCTRNLPLSESPGVSPRFHSSGNWAPENSHHGHTAPDEAGQGGGSPRRELPAAMPGWDGRSRGCRARGSCAQGQRGHPPPASLPCMLPTSLAFKARRAGEGPGPRELRQEARVPSPTRNGGATSGRLSMPGPPGDAPVPCCRRRSIASSWYSVCSLPALLLRWRGCPQSCLPHHSQGPARCPAVQMLGQCEQGGVLALQQTLPVSADTGG